MEAVAAGDDVAAQLVALARVGEADRRPVAVEVGELDVRALEQRQRARRLARGDQVLDDLLLPVDGDRRVRRSARRSRSGAPRPPKRSSIPWWTIPSRRIRSPTPGRVEQVGRALLEHAGADAPLEVLAAPAPRARPTRSPRGPSRCARSSPAGPAPTIPTWVTHRLTCSPSYAPVTRRRHAGDHLRDRHREHEGERRGPAAAEVVQHAGDPRAERAAAGSRRMSVIAVSDATAPGSPPRSTGRISASPSAPPWPRPSTTIQSGAAPSATSRPSAAERADRGDRGERSAPGCATAPRAPGPGTPTGSRRARRAPAAARPPASV